MILVYMIAIPILIYITSTHMIRSAIVCGLCYMALPMSDDFDMMMFFACWALFGVMVCMGIKNWALFGVGFYLGQRK